MMEVRDFREQTASMERSSPGASAQRPGIAMYVESIDPPAISNQFHAISTWRVRPTHGETPQKPDLASRTSCRLLGHLPVLKTAEPGKMCLNARYGILAVRKECARSAGVSI